MQTLIGLTLLGMTIFLVFSIAREIQMQTGKTPISFTEWFQKVITKIFL